MPVLFLIVLGTSIWVAVDASSIGVKKGQLQGLAGMGPAGWFFACLLLWIFAFPFYLCKRGALKRINAKTPQPTTSASEGARTYTDLDQLHKLGQLRDSGVLTEDEFQAKKAQLLGLPPPVPPAPSTSVAQTVPQTQPTSPPAPPAPPPQSAPQPNPPSPAALDNRAAPCPGCGKSILLRTVKAGRNTCPHCQKVFTAK